MMQEDSFSYLDQVSSCVTFFCFFVLHIAFLLIRSFIYLHHVTEFLFDCGVLSRVCICSLFIGLMLLLRVLFFVRFILFSQLSGLLPLPHFQHLLRSRHLQKALAIQFPRVEGRGDGDLQVVQLLPTCLHF
jgi:hypothetical protein